MANDTQCLEQAVEELKQKYQSKIITMTTEVPRLHQWDDSRVCNSHHIMLIFYSFDRILT